MMEMAEANPFRMLSAYFITKEMINPKMAWNNTAVNIGRCLNKYGNNIQVLRNPKCGSMLHPSGRSHEV